ncbi:MAG: HAD family hydrolase [Oscillospiraceae bacterium]
MIKLIASDMDGTLLDNEKRLPADFFEVLEQLNAQNIHFVAASGRSYVTLRENFLPNSDKMDFICDNGAVIVSKGVVTEISLIDRQIVNEIIEICEKIDGIRLLLCGINGTYHIKSIPEFDEQINYYYVNQKCVESLYNIDDGIFKVAICDLNNPQNNSYPILKERFKNRLALQISGKFWADLMNIGINKGKALQNLQEKMHITPDETMAFGDYDNDIELLKMAKYSFVMANAEERMKKYGNFEAKANSENGVMEAIRQYVFMNKH